LYQEVDFLMSASKGKLPPNGYEEFPKEYPTVSYKQIKEINGNVIFGRHYFSGKVEQTNHLGKIIRENYYKNGKMHGVSKYYYFNGELESIGLWINGVQEGLEIGYSISGEILYSEIYVHGKVKEPHQTRSIHR
jgi:antitoxin component YwqK of YwqJK toxin-antitoxin module